MQVTKQVERWTVETLAQYVNEHIWDNGGDLRMDVLQERYHEAVTSDENTSRQRIYVVER